MKGLLYKEWTILTGSYKRSVLFFAVFYGIISILSRQAYMGYALILVFAMLAGSTISFDENSHWDTYARTLPVTPAQIVGCKYLLGLGGIALGNAVAVLIAVLVNLRSPVYDYAYFHQSAADIAAALLVCSSMALLFVAAILPFSYKFNSVNARSRIFLLFAVLSAAGGLVISVLPDNTRDALVHQMNSMEEIHAMLLFAGLFAAVLLVYAVSYKICVGIYKRKEY